MKYETVHIRTSYFTLHISMYTSQQEKAFFDKSKDILAAENPLPTQMFVEPEISTLRDILVYHEWRYSVKNDPVISDFEYDSLYKRLEAIETAFPHLVSPDSPTQRVSSDLSDSGKNVEHLVPMLSLDNSYNAEDLKEFDERVRKVAFLDENVPIEYVVEPKFDGGSIALVYENDKLVRGATRGNGVKGEEMTANAKAMKSIPLTAIFSARGVTKTELRGEVLIRKDIFKQVNIEREKAGKTIFANPRNAATGGLRMKDPKESAERKMEAFIYQLGYAVNAAGENVLEQFETHDESIEYLANLGFKVPTIERKVCKNIEEVADFCLAWEAKRESYEYEIDGMVVKVNNRKLQETVGYTSHHPRWAIAYKFKAKQATSKLEKVEYQVGKIGSITPVAKIAPVQLAGVTVTSVSLHNEDFITGKDLHLGDTVLVERAGDVIPYIVKAMEDLRDGSEIKIEFPENCPINTTDTPVKLIRAEGVAAWRCPNCVCGAQELQRIIFHVSKPAMDIDGFGESNVEKFYDLGWLKTIADVYRLDYEKIGVLEGFGKRSVEKLEKAINKAKKNPIHRLLHSLTIHHLGKKVSRLIAAEIKHVFDLKEWDLETFTNIKDVGPVVAENVIAWLAEPENIEMLETMESLGVNLTQTEDDIPKALATDGPFSGKTILFTGKLLKMGRKVAQQKAEAAGAKNISAISSKLDILVAGEKAGSKLKKATALGTVEILTEDEFIERIS